jgi:hypothetical protein
VTPRRSPECLDGKVPLRTVAEAGIAARRFSRELNAEGKLAPSFYVYRCPSCHAYHLTHREVWNGTRNRLLHAAAPEALQRWAFPS